MSGAAGRAINSSTRLSIDMHSGSPPKTNCPGELNIVRSRRPAGPTGILARLQQELSTARSRNEAAEIFGIAERLLSPDELDTFSTYCADILREILE
jgi:hypothetical protein